MEKGKILENLATSIVTGEEEIAATNAKAVLELQMDPMEAVEGGLSKGMDAIGEQFESGDVFLPELLMAANAFKAAMEILQPHIPKEQLEVKNKIVIGTAKDDIHDIGKSIVSSMMEASGFEVYDVGKDVPEENFISKGGETSADILAVSALMTVTMPRQKELIKELERLGLRQKYKVLVGGGPVTKEWAEEIGADGTGKDAKEAVNVAKNILG